MDKLFLAPNQPKPSLDKTSNLTELKVCRIFMQQKEQEKSILATQIKEQVEIFISEYVVFDNESEKETDRFKNWIRGFLVGFGIKRQNGDYNFPINEGNMEDQSLDQFLGDIISNGQQILDEDFLEKIDLLVPNRRQS